MKKLVLGIVGFLMLNNILAQGFAVGVSSGYNFAVLKAQYGLSGVMYNGDSSMSEPAKTSFGKGIDLQVELSYRRKKVLEFGLTTIYHSGSPSSFKFEEYALNASGNPYIINRMKLSFEKISQIQFNPYLKIVKGKKVKGYLKFGPVL